MNGAASRAPSWPTRVWHAASKWTRAFVWHPDPLVESNNWVAFLVGTHLPFWPLYLWGSAGKQAFPTALLTMVLTPAFLVIPPIARRHGLLGRVATPVMGIVNAVLYTWILGPNSGATLFLIPCAVLAAFSFRRDERWWMIALTSLPLAVLYGLKYVPLAPLHRYDPEALKSLFALNVISVSVLGTAFGWLLSDLYRRLEKPPVPKRK